MFDNLEEIEQKYEELTNKISDPEEIKNQQSWTKMMKERAEIEEVVLKYREYKKTKKEYTLDLKQEKLTEISKEGKYIIYHNGNKMTASKSDFFLKDQIFDNKSDSQKEVGNYVYYEKNNRIYKYLKGYESHPILLLELTDIKEWYLKEKEILLLKGNTLYSYNDGNGLRKIVENNELNYNYKNIYQLGEK